MALKLSQIYISKNIWENASNFNDGVDEFVWNWC